MSAQPEGNLDAIRDLVFGSVAGMAAKLFEHPFDLVKVRLQSQPTDRPLVYKGPLDAFRQTYMSEGAKGLYRGLSAPVVGAAMENATIFYVYSRCQAGILAMRPPSERSQPLSIAELGLAGAGAGAVTSFVLTPVELIKCRMQVQAIAGSPPPGTGPVIVKTALEAPGSPSSTVVLPREMLRTQPRGPFALIAETVRTGGIRGLWLGQTGTLVRETGGGAAWFGFYELIARAFIKEKQKTMPVGQVATKADLATWQVCLAGVAGGVSYIVSLFPADCIKSTIQVSAELYPNRPPPGFIETGVDIWRTRGIRGLYAGCGLTCLKGGPSSAIIFVLFETMQTHFAWAFERPTKGPRADALV